MNVVCIQQFISSRSSFRNLNFGKFSEHILLGQDYDASDVILKLIGCDLCTGAVDVVFIMVANM